MFESLAEKLQAAFDRLRGKGRITEANTSEALREIRLALLEADVNYKVVKQFTDAVLERATGQDVVKSVSPGQQIVKIVNDELVKLMGPVDHSIPLEKGKVSTIMLVGLQGCGKTTTAAKLAKYLSAKGHKPLLVAADVQRPAAIEQLKALGEQLDTPVFSEVKGRPAKICQRALKVARKGERDVVILDTAGRLHIDDALMAELQDISDRTNPVQTYLVCDAMTGQDAVNSAVEFDRRIKIDGVILTKLDGDARGGAALSVKAVTGKPIKFAGVGEQLDKLEQFHPDRMASRILGMGDIVSFVEKAQEVTDLEAAEKLQEKIRKKTLTLDDFLHQLRQVKRMGPLKEIMSLVPGMKGVDVDTAQDELPHIEAIICSMTPNERHNPDVIEGSRRRRIARGASVQPVEVNQLLKQFKQMKKIMHKFASGGGGIPSMSMGQPGVAVAPRVKKPRKKRRRRGRR